MMVSPTASTDELLEQSASYRLSVSEVSTVIKLCQEIKYCVPYPCGNGYWYLCGPNLCMHMKS